MFEDLNPPKPITKHQDLPGWKEPAPTPATKVKHAAKAGTRILKAAINREPILVGAEELKRRDDICNACDLWKPSGNLGMGECTHPQCGCTKLKRGLATETCPAGKWT